MVDRALPQDAGPRRTPEAVDPATKRALHRDSLAAIWPESFWAAEDEERQKTSSQAKKPRLTTTTTTPPPTPPPQSSSQDTQDDGDAESVCSDKCSQDACTGGCDEPQCKKDQYIESCFGFIDCDDSELCTRPDCAEAECRDDAPPCFKMSCLQGMTDEEVAAAKNLAATAMWVPAGPVPNEEIGSTKMAKVDDTTYSYQASSDDYRNFLDSSVPKPYGSAAAHASAAASFSCPMPGLGHCTARHQSDISNQCLLDSSQLENSTAMGAALGNTAVHCQWGGNCSGQFLDWPALDEHIYHNHVKPYNEVLCRWNDCLQATDPDDIMEHVLNHHPLDGTPQTCRWSECTSTIPGPDELASHVRSMHVPVNPLQCQWDACGVVAHDVTDLSMHLQTDHFFDALSSLKAAEGEALTSPAASARCRWLMVNEEGKVNGERECGVTCIDAGAMQQHIKEAHIGQLTKKVGFVCQWADCVRRGTLPFGQRGKLERHIQVHTGCKFPWGSIVCTQSIG